MSRWEEELQICYVCGLMGQTLISLAKLRTFFLETHEPGSPVFQMALRYYCTVISDFARFKGTRSGFKPAMRVATCYWLLSPPELNDEDEWTMFEHAKKDAWRRWSMIKGAARFLGLHSRAVITANHPNRKRDRKEFECT
jgi:hypothetical protein